MCAYIFIYINNREENFYKTTAIWKKKVWLSCLTLFRHAYAHTHTYIHAHIHTHIHIHTHTHTYIHAHMHSYTHIHTHIDITK